MLFDVGNLITLGIVLLSLIMFRLMDRSSRSLDKVKKYTERCKDDIAAYITDKVALIKNFGIDLDVERKSAAELLRRIQNLTREELSQKVQALTQIEERIQIYDSSLEELVQMTGRVQENLVRIRDESAFVESIGKKVGESREKVDYLDGEIENLGKKLKTIEVSFERDNTQTLEKIAEGVLSSARAAVMDLESESQTIERRVEDHREAIDRLETGREERLARDEQRIEKLLAEAIDRAGSRADKVEESALAKLRGEAQERVNQIKSDFDENIKTVKDSAATKIAETQEQLANTLEAWKAEHAAAETTRKTESSSLKKDIEEEFKIVKDSVIIKIAETREQLENTLNAWKGEYTAAETARKTESSSLKKDIEEEFKIVKDSVMINIAEAGERLTNTLEAWKAEYTAAETAYKTESSNLKKDMEEFGELAGLQKEQWNRDIREMASLARQQAGELDNTIKNQRAELEASLRDTGLRVIGEAQQRLDEYRQAQDEQYRQLAGITNDAGRLEEELRRSMGETISRINGEFSRFGGEIQTAWENSQSDFNSRLQALRGDIDGVDRELTGIKERAFENVSKKLQGFEDDFLANLSGRSAEIDNQLALWRETLDKRLETISAEAEQNRRQAEDRVDGVLAGLSTKGAEVDNQLALWRDALDKRLETISAEAEQNRRQAENRVDGVLANLSGKGAEVDNQLALWREALDKRLETISAEAEQNRQQAEDRVDGVLAGLSGRSAEVDNQLALWQEALDKRLETISAEAEQNRQQAEDRVDGVLANLSGKGAEVDNQLALWREALDKRLETMAAEAEQNRQQAEALAAENAKKALAAQSEKITAELERLNEETATFEKGIRGEMTAADESRKAFGEQLAQGLAEIKTAAENELTTQIDQYSASVTETLRHSQRELKRLKDEAAAFEEGIREEMRAADESRKAFGEQLERGLAETKTTAENELGAKIDQYSLSVTETLRQSQREMETHIKDLSAGIGEQIAALDASAGEFRKNAENWQSQHVTRMREIDDSMEEMRRRGRELVSENEERMGAARASMDEIRKEITVQTKMFERTDALKEDLDRHVEDMSGNIGRLSQLKNEITRFETQFTEIKRLEDDVNAKMTRFLSEKRRIEVMENDFNRLLQTSQSVEEKLTQVSNSDDILQTMQVQIRRFEDVIRETEEKYQRVEKKSKILQETNDGIDRNFRALQEDEHSIERLSETIGALKTDIDSIQSSVEALSAENEKARDAAEKLDTLDESVKWLEKRIAEMNVARESLARLATEMQELDKDAQTQLKLIRTLLDRNAATTSARGKLPDEGAPPPRDRETIIKLKRQGWSVDEIARTLKIAKGEVELVLELGSKDL